MGSRESPSWSSGVLSPYLGIQMEKDPQHPLAPRGWPTEEEVKREPGKTVLECPGYSRIKGLYLPEGKAYGYNYMGLEVRQGRPKGLGLGGISATGNTPLHAVPESRVVSPARMIAVTDSQFSKPLPDWQEGRPNGSGLATPWRGGTEAESLRRKRHKTPWNIVFCDGHVEAQKTSELRASDDASLSRWNNDHQPHRDLLQDW